MSEYDARGYLIAYDIADARRWRRVHRLVSGIAVPIQYSVFLAPCLTRRELDQSVEQLRAQIHDKQDDIRIYPLPTPPTVYFYGPNPLPAGEGLLQEKPLWVPIQALLD
ncbi:CRISPR-associated protein, Cas2 family [Fontimonas thermophila]|uniref:CRISPR-associated endoribonuclease Cas2 n=1 Tax=Fontimonas thermophila TaxID=1076937 RepID=A0A1I2J295_9GAMM|nr:CRISPR-associated endonuclease Cas2 [Fontimonas thermophila]SFF47387.1 CRISPR-associated protein, Cas2 family [Fontimonas thermophila]